MFEHEKNNHSIDFAGKNNAETHTQNYEGLQSNRKRFLRNRKGKKQEDHLDFIRPFVWKYFIEKNHINVL